MGTLSRLAHEVKNIGSGQAPIKQPARHDSNYLEKLLTACTVQISQLVLAVHRCISDVAVYRVGIKSPSGLVVYPNRSSHVYFKRIKSDNYLVRVTHTDRLIHRDRRSLIAYVDVASGETSKLVEASRGLAVANSGRAFSYLGGGKQNDNAYTQSFIISIPSEERWIRLSIVSPLRRVINLDTVAISPVRQDPEALSAETIQNWIAGHERALEATSILYADIDLNVVDGSSVWLSSMASILCASGLCILVAKKSIARDIVTSNIVNRDNLIILSPEQIGFVGPALPVEIAVATIRLLDEHLPNLRQIVVRGLRAATHLCDTRQFRERSAVYLTDFYKVGADDIVSTAEQKQAVTICAVQSGIVLVQTPAIDQRIRAIAERDLKTFLLPPPIPADLAPRANEVSRPSSPSIGYAGKIAANWGLDELLLFAREQHDT